MYEPGIAPSLSGMGAIAPLGPLGRAVLRCREADIDRLSAQLGLPLPRATCRSAHDIGLSALWLGPDEWLILTSAPTDGWVAELDARSGASRCSLVDVSHRQVALSVRGLAAERILAAGCALDLSLSAFPVGMCTRTMFAKAEIVLWRTAPDYFHIEVWRSFAKYVEALLREAESEE